MHALLAAVTQFAAALLPPAAGLVRQLAQAAALGTLFVAAVWLVCRAAPRLPAGARCALWWLASLKLVLGLVWPAPISLPLPTSAALPRWAAAGDGLALRPRPATA